MGIHNDRFLHLYSTPGHVLRRAWQFAQATFERQVAPLGITSPQFSILYAISVTPGMEQQEVAQAVHYDPATTGGVLLRLEKAGMVRRKPSRRSPRGRAIYLTPEGEAMLQRVLPAIWRNQIVLLERLDDDEKAVLLKLLSKMAGIDNSFNPRTDETETAEPPTA
jgi:MarR family transcriptional regulator, lower aerobic nicotinate degradation pathway regulator